MSDYKDKSFTLPNLELDSRIHGYADVDTFTARGNPAILSRSRLALFCSNKCPGDLIVKTYDLAQKLRDMGVIVISGFHAPVVKECLAILLHSPHPLIYCPARNIDTYRLPANLRTPLAAGRLLLLSPFARDVTRITADTAQQRNRFVAAVATRIFVCHAAPGSGTEQFCRELTALGKRIMTFASESNRNIIETGAIPVDLADIRSHVDELALPLAPRTTAANWPSEEYTEGN
jgi:predicted Rossmann fold nucleotide-binding protein DprA/Smf involved in DNA uptake